MGKCEYNVEVRNRKQISGLLHYPVLPGTGLTLRTVPVSTGVIRDGLIATSGTPVYMTSQRCRAAVADGTQHLQVRPAEVIPVAFDEAVAGLANDIGHLKGGPVHPLTSLRERFTKAGVLTSITSSGLATEVR